MTPSLHTLFHFGLFCTRNTYFVTQPRRGIPPLWPNTPRASDMKHGCCLKKKKKIITRHFKLPRRPYSDLLWNSERVKWGLLWELKGKIYILLNVMRKKESEGEEEGEISQLRCCALSLISKFTDLATVNIYPHSVGDCQNDVKTEADFLFQGLTCCVCSCECVQGICVPKYCRFCGVGISNPMPAGRHVSMKGESTIAFSVCVCVLRFLPFFPQLQGFFLV